MKKTIGLFGATALAVLMVFLAAACPDDTSKDKGESPYKGEKLVVTNQQLSEHAVNAHGPTNAYINSSKSGELLISDQKGNTLGTGTITGGKINFTLNEPGNKYKIDDEAAFGKAFHDFWDNVTVVEPADDTIEGNDVRMMIFHEDEGINDLFFREKTVGTKDSVALETIVFIYVNGNCRIKGNAKQGMVPGTGYFSSEDIDLALEKGWNLVCRKMLYGSEVVGTNIISMEIKNLVDFKWAIWVEHPL